MNTKLKTILMVFMTLGLMVGVSAEEDITADYSLSEQVDSYSATDIGTKMLITSDGLEDTTEATITFYNDGEVVQIADGDAEFTETVEETANGNYGVVIDHAGELDDVDIDQIEINPGDTDALLIEDATHYYETDDDTIDGNNEDDYTESITFNDFTYYDSEDNQVDMQEDTISFILAWVIALFIVIYAMRQI